MNYIARSKQACITIFRFILLSVMLTSLIGCGAAAQPAATATQENTPTNPPPTSTYTPAPTNTPLPTNTPTPTDTATPLPTSTATPDMAATQAFESTQVTEQLTEEIKSQLAELGFPTDVGYLGWVQTRPSAIGLDTFGEYLYDPFAEDIVASDFVLRTDITWETEGLVMCGLMFRSEPNFEVGAQYAFVYLRISGLPAWGIDYYDEGYYKSTVTDVKFSSAIDMKNGATNNLVLAAEGNKFTVFINDERLGSFYDWSSLRSEGLFAFLASQEKGPSTCTFDNTWVWMLK